MVDHGQNSNFKPVNHGCYNHGCYNHGCYNHGCYNHGCYNHGYNIVINVKLKSIRLVKMKQ